MKPSLEELHNLGTSPKPLITAVKMSIAAPRGELTLVNTKLTALGAENAFQLSVANGNGRANARIGVGAKARNFVKSPSLAT